MLFLIHSRPSDASLSLKIDNKFKIPAIERMKDAAEMGLTGALESLAEESARTGVWHESVEGISRP